MHLDIRNRVTQFWTRRNAGLLLFLSAMPGFLSAQTVLSAPTSQSLGQIAVNGSTPATQVIGYVLSGTTNPVFSLAYGTEYSIATVQCTGSGNITCSVSIGFQPHFPGLRQDAVLAKDKSGNVIGSTLLYGLGLGPLAGLYPGVISTIVGSGGWGYSGDGGLSTAATLANPQGVAIDNLGNLYIADSLNQVVREVSVTTGRISTVAGTGRGAYTGDGGPAAKATLNTPMAVAFDGAGNLYIADQGNNVIRKVSAATGKITTVAGGGSGASGPDGLGDGGPATNALLNGPNDVAVDGAGNLYIADSFNGLIRRVDATSGNITVLAGSGLNNPTGVAVDTAGNLYIADTGNSVVRRVNLSSGQMSVMAGTGTPGYSGDLGPAVSAKLSSPVCVRLDAAGNLYIVDQGKSVVRQVNAQSGIITTIAGTGAPGYFGDAGIPTSAALHAPTGVALDSTGTVYIADNANNVIRKISQTSALVFQNTVVGEASSPEQISVLNIGNQPLSLSGLAVTSNFAQVTAGGAICSSSSVLASAANCTIAVDFIPTTSGTSSGKLTLTDNSLNITGTQSVALTGTGVVGAVPQLSFSPSTLTFAAQAVGTSSSAQSVTLSNPGAAALNISSIQLGGTNAGDFRATGTCQYVLAAKGACSISITFSPSAAGTRTASLIVVDNLPNSPQTLTITGGGGAPQIAFSPAVVTFGSQPVGSTSPSNTVTISNTGSAVLNIATMALAGTNAAEFSMTTTCGGAVTAGASCSLSILFTPQAMGQRTATLTMSDNGSGAVQTVVVTGTGGLASDIDSSETQYYAGAEQHVHELYIANSGWHDRDITAAAQGPNSAVGTPVSTVMDPFENVFRVNYIGIDQHLHELYTAGGPWYDCDLTVASGGLNLALKASISSFVDTIQGALRINYAAIDKHVHQLYAAGGAWHDFDLTASTGGPNLAAGATITSIVDTVQNLLRINYAGIDQHLHQFYIAGSAWHDFDLTAAAKGPNLASNASIDALIDTTANTLRINYAGSDQHAHEFYVSGGAWHDFDLTAAAGGPNLATGASISSFIDTIANILRINYASTDQQVHEFYIAGGAWHDCGLTAAARGSNIAAGAAIHNAVDSSSSMLRINYAGIDLHIHELYLFGGAWHDSDLTSAAGGPLAAK